MITINETSEGCILPVRAQPGARKVGVQGEIGGALKVAVQAPPEQGKANKALIEVLAKCLQVKRSQIELMSGEASKDKKFLIRGVTKQQLQAVVDQIVGTG